MVSPKRTLAGQAPITARPKAPEKGCVHAQRFRGVQTDREKTKLSALRAEINTMKVIVRKLVVLLNVGVLSAVAASAASMEETYLASCRKDPGMPVPVTVVSPSVGPEYDGRSVQLEFVVSEDGKPSGFSIKSASDDVLAKLVVEAVKQWRFLPAEVDGKPVATKVSLPVKIVDPVTTGSRYAAVR